MKRAHVVGAGLAGLSAAMALADAGWRVALYEAAPQAGGRCRSYVDRELGCRIDNGNHLLLSGNRAAMEFLARVGAADTLAGPGAPVFPFLDAPSGRRWVLRISPGRMPWWLFKAASRVPGTRLGDYLALLKLRFAGAEDTVSGVLPQGALWHNLLEPLAIAALNTSPETGSARLLNAVVTQSLGAGGAACVPCFPREGLSESFIDPALRRLAIQHCVPQLGRRVAGLEMADGRVAALLGPDGPARLEPGDAVVLAVPAPVAADLLPGLLVPDAFEAIVNVHFRTDAKPLGDAAEAGFVGVVGGTAEWVFAKPGIASVTISAANRLVDQPAEALARAVWPDVRAALGWNDPAGGMPPGAMPPWRVVKEKRATFAATPAQERRRPGARTALANLVLAGDWTATGLPATIEGAIRSGKTAVATLLSSPAG